MITEDYVSFETARLLKEKGFNEKVICYYDDGGSLNLNKFDNHIPSLCDIVRSYVDFVGTQRCIAVCCCFGIWVCELGEVRG